MFIVLQASTEIGIKASELLKLFNSRTCQLVLGAEAVSVAGLRTITIRNLASASLALAALLIPGVKQHLMQLATSATEKQSSSLVRNFDNATKDYQEHLAELDKKIVQVADAALNQQLANWTTAPRTDLSCQSLSSTEKI